MDMQVITGPLVGGVIGYFTNYIAVRMLFRPLKPVYIGGRRLPFTPGIIPKGKERLAKAVGNVVGGTLLTKDEIKKVLLSDDIVSKIKEETEKIIKEQESNTATIREMADRLAGEEVVAEGLEKLEKGLTEKLMDKANSLSIGNMIAEQVIEAVKEKVSSNPLMSMVVNESLLKSFAQPVADKIDYYISVNGPEIVKEKLSEEIDGLCEKQIGEVVSLIDKSGIDAGSVIVRGYKNVIEDKTGNILEELNIAGIIEEKILSMDVLEIEKLLLSVMDKELNAIVNLGAVIGFVLGCINIFI